MSAFVSLSGDPDRHGAAKLASLREMKAERLAAEASTRRAEAQARVHEGNQLVAQEKWDEALAAYRAAVELNPEMTEAWFAIGASEAGRNGSQSCEAMYAPLQKCVELCPGHAAAHCCLGGLLTHFPPRKDVVRAEEHFRRAIRLDPKCAEAHLGLSFVLEDRKNLDGAIREMFDCMRLSGDTDGTGKARVAKLLKKNHDLKRAKQNGTDAQFTNAAAKALATRADAFTKLKKWDEALASYRAAVEKDPELASAWFGIGGCEIHRDGGEICEAAYAPLKKYLELAPDGSAAAHAHLGLGKVYLLLRKDDARAEEHLRAAVRLNPNLDSAHGFLAAIRNGSAHRHRSDSEGVARTLIEQVAPEVFATRSTEAVVRTLIEQEMPGCLPAESTGVADMLKRFAEFAEEEAKVDAKKPNAAAMVRPPPHRHPRRRHARHRAAIELVSPPPSPRRARRRR